MRKLNQGILVTLIGGTLIVAAITIDKTSRYITSLENDINSRNVTIQEITKEIEDITLKNKELLTKNEQLLEENKQLQEELDDLMFKEVIFNKNDVTIPSNVSVKQLEILFRTNNRYNALIGLEEAFVKVEREYGVNAIFVLGIVSQESLYGRSRRAIEDNNLVGYEIYHNGSVKKFSSKEESIMAVGRLLSKDYLNGGKYYKGEDIFSINDTYCITEDKYEWSNNIISITNKYISEINDLVN